MKRFSVRVVLAILVTVMMVVAAAGEQPNIIIMMSDDMGYSDIGCYGSEIDTPALDTLAANGLRFTRFYNTARCCPTRASLLTGLYPHQAGIGHMTHDRGVDGYRGELNRSSVTIGEALQTAGYSTYAVGKWHVTKGNRADGPKFNWPLQRGFDRYYGIINGATSFWDPATLVRGNTMITYPTDPEYKPDEPYFFTDAISDNASRYIREHKTGKPFFMYVAYTAAHWPMQARPRDIVKYEGKYDVGYEAIRKARFEKMKKLGVIAADSELSPAPDTWSNVEDKRWEAACMEVYAAMIDNMDQGIGRIVGALRDREMLDNTLIFFLQDNGGCAESGRRKADAPPNPRAAKPSLPLLEPGDMHYWGSAPKQTRDGWPVRSGHAMPGPADTYIGYGKNWANVSNTPFREYKHWVHEGGISTPLVVHWPDGIAAKNELRDEPSHLIDLMATCVDVAGAKYPAEYKGHKITPMEGKSLAPVFAGKSVDRKAIYWEHEGNRAVRIGKWKLVAKGKARQDEVRWELYNADADRSELHDLASQQPDRVEKMKAMWWAYAKRTHVVPWPKAKK